MNDDTDTVKTPDPIVAPSDLLEALIGIALATKEGSHLVAGFRLAHPSLHPSKGQAEISCPDGTIKLSSQPTINHVPGQAPANGRSREQAVPTG